jgi:hypothetical protein
MKPSRAMPAATHIAHGVEIRHRQHIGDAERLGDVALALHLEQALGVTLFERDTRNVHLSYEGEALMRHVARAFEELRRGWR